MAMSPREWLEFFREWERLRDQRMLTKHGKKIPGKAGRPPKDQTGQIHAEWVKLGRPKITAATCDRIARSFFSAELKGIDAGSPEHRKVREGVRQAISRCKPNSAT